MDRMQTISQHASAPVQNPWGSSHVSGLEIADFKRFYRGLRIGS